MGKCLINGTNNNSNDGRAIQILNFLVNNGLTPKQACAICGNCYVESNKKYDPKAYNPNDNGGPSYGLFQWHDNGGSGRFTNLKNYCNSNNLDYTTIGGQLSFLWSENAGNFKSYFSSNTDLSIDAYTKWWEKHWEVCGTCHHSERLAEANRLAGLYNQLNKGECTVELTGGSGSGGDDGFSCETSGVLDSSINLGTEITPATAAGPGGESSSTTNTLSRKPVFIGDYVGHNIFTNSSLKYNAHSFSRTEGKFGRTGIEKTVKSVISNRKYIPQYLIFYFGSGFDLSWAKSINSLRDGMNEWLWKLDLAAGNTKFFLVSVVNPSTDIVSVDPNGGKGTFMYNLNQIMKEWANDTTNNGKYVELSDAQARILANGGYRKKSGNDYVFTNKSLQLIGDAIWAYCSTFAKNW